MIVIVTAMDKEYDLISEWIAKNWLDYKNVQNIALIKSGIGKVNAASCLTEFLSSNTSSKVTRVISVGCAGAAVAGLKPGNVVIGNSYCYHDVYCGEPNANGQVQGMPAVFPSDFSWIDMDERFRLGTIASGDKFVTTREQVLAIKEFLPNSYNVCAIDMESAALAQVCYKKGIGFTSIRVISDNPLEPNQTDQYAGFWDSLAEKAFSVVCKLLENDTKF